MPYVWLLLFFFVPFLLVVKISFADLRLGIPPYTELVAMKDGVLHIALDFSHYAFLLHRQPVFRHLYEFAAGGGGIDRCCVC